MSTKTGVDSYNEQCRKSQAAAVDQVLRYEPSWSREALLAYAKEYGSIRVYQLIDALREVDAARLRFTV